MKPSHSVRTRCILHLFSAKCLLEMIGYNPYFPSTTVPKIGIRRLRWPFYCGYKAVNLIFQPFWLMAACCNDAGFCWTKIFSCSKLMYSFSNIFLIIFDIHFAAQIDHRFAIVFIETFSTPESCWNAHDLRQKDFRVES